MVRVAAGAFDELAALDLHESLNALAELRRATDAVAIVAQQLREAAFAAISGCDDVRLRRRLLAVKRDLFNGRSIDPKSVEGLPHLGEYAAAVARLDEARERFERAFELEVTVARNRLHTLAASEALQRPLARSSLALLAQIRRRVTPHTERALMKYVSRMHAKTSPFSTFCHVAPAAFEPLASGIMSARFGEQRVSVRMNPLARRPEEELFEDSVLGGEAVCDERAIDAITESIGNYARDVAFSDPAIRARQDLRSWFLRRYGRHAVVPLAQLCDEAQTGVSVLHDSAKRWTSALASRLEVSDDRVYIDRQHVDHAFAAVPELRRCVPQSIGAMLQLANDDRDGVIAVVNNCGPGYGKFVSRFLDLMPESALNEQCAINRAAAGSSRLVEVRDESRLNMNRHPPLVDGEISSDDFGDLVVKIGGDDTLWLWHVPAGQRLEVLDLGLQDPATRSPLHQFLNTFFTRAEQLVRKPLVAAALAASRGSIVKPRVIYDRRLVLRRRSWVVPKAMLPLRAAGESDASYFARVAGWRESLAMPAYVFARIRKAAKRDDRKPQFLSFASWHSVALFEKLIGRVTGTLTFQEMLPGPADMLEWNGRRHAAEFVVQWNRSE
jgi:hypothetical protein